MDQPKLTLGQAARLYRASKALHNTLESRPALTLAVAEAVRLAGAQSGFVALVNPTTGRLEIEAAQGLPAGGERPPWPVSEGITGWVVRTRRTGIWQARPEERRVRREGSR